ncbi:DUF6054 family protein [Marinilactibacillus piezotolerans]|uniref:DUF6054 family protein n=1 Tax=Marinilactibacillus piezotolerans TaxID=258723 RepID=UPI0009B01DE5|nr:DUF6054 family protein [Marinilactibacillus piezotolerans]
MTKYIFNTNGDFNRFVGTVQDIAAHLSNTTEFEGGHRFTSNTAFLVYERYSLIGSSRVSLSIVITESDGQIQLAAISSGGSQAMVLKINTWGEDAFLNKFIKALESTEKTW